MLRILNVLLILTVLSVPASAQTPSVSELNDEGMKKFSEGHYAVAADIFGRAYSLEPRAELLKNAAVAWYQAENCSNAVAAASSFVESEGVSIPEANQMRGLIGACKIRLAQEAVAANSLELAEKLLAEVEANSPDKILATRVDAVRVEIAKRRLATPAPEIAAPFALDALDLAPEKIEHESEIEAVAPPPPRRRSRVAGPVLTALGAAVLSGGLVYHIIAKTKLESEFRTVGPAGRDRERYDQLNDALRIANVLIPLAYVVGGLTTATGIYFWVAPAPEGGAVVAWSVSF